MSPNKRLKIEAFIYSCGMIMILILIAEFFVGCAKFKAIEPTTAQSCTVSGETIICPDGTLLDIPRPIDGVDGRDGIDGNNGIDGINGVDGDNAVLLTLVNSPANSCTKVYDGIWVENIHTGKVFDVYYNDQCKDSMGEFCDNVVPSDDAVGSVGQYRGSGTVCWANNVMLSGTVDDSGDILLRILDFN